MVKMTARYGRSEAAMPMNSQPEGSKPLRRMRIAAGWGLCALPVIALAYGPLLYLRGQPTVVAAAGPAAPPVQPNAGSGGGAPAGQNESSDFQEPGQHSRFNSGNSGQMTQQDWDNAEQWMEKNAPRRWSYLQTVKNTNAQAFKREFREFFVPRIRQINWLQQSDTKLYDLRMQRIELEDEAFGMLQDLVASKNPTEKTALTNSLKGKLGDMYDNTLAERQQRINELATFLETEQQKLKDDQQPDHRDKHVENTLNRALQTGSLENPSRENAPHMPHGNGPMFPPPPPQTQPSPAN
jgi:hypothetical protein